MSESLYKRNFLKNVIFRVDFWSEESTFEQLVSKDNIDILKTRFEILEPMKTIQNTNINIDINKKTMETQNKEIKKFVFRKKDQSAILIIQQDAVSIEYSKYNNSTELKEDVDVLGKVFSSVSVMRIGLRYINYIESNRFGDINWDLYINSKLVKNEKFDYHGELLQSITVTDIKYDDYVIKFQHGIYNQNMPGDRIRDTYVLDYDAYTNNIPSKCNLKEIVEKFNLEIEKLFEQCITDDFREVLLDEGKQL